MLVISCPLCLQLLLCSCAFIPMQCINSSAMTVIAARVHTLALNMLLLQGFQPVLQAPGYVKQRLL